MITPFATTRLTATIGGREIIVETGRLANQADGAVWVQSGGTVVLVTAVTQPLERDINFMPLVVNYQEMSYASGRIPGNYFRREIGRPSERETLISRFIDRPIRPLFPEGFRDEVQIIATVISAEAEEDPDMLAMTGASAALHISKTPFLGPIAGIRVGHVDGRFVANPTLSQMGSSTLNLILAGSRDAVVMVEGGAEFASEELMAEAITWGHEQLQPLIDLQEELRTAVGRPKMEVQAPKVDQELVAAVKELAAGGLSQATSVEDKMERQAAKKQVKQQVLEKLAERYPDQPEVLKMVPDLLKDLEKEIVRERISTQGKRIDGRDMTTVRDLTMEIGALPRAHGSAIFARGETKVLGVTTLGSTRDEQRIETITGETFKRFMLHYNFPPYCVGEAKMLRGPARREIGHGALAERALSPVLPPSEDFPFSIRVVTEVMESNGSSSMGSVCAGSMALMDAGVPVSTSVAGIAMGLIKDEGQFFILTDILGDEDHLGDMDFKVAGSREGITAIQMDIKISGIPAEILGKALQQARQARLHILDSMEAVIAKPRQELSEHAPQLEVVEVDPERIKDVIGPGGKNIKAMTAATGASIDIEDTGRISIFAPTLKSLREAVDMVLFYDQKPELGKDYLGKVKRLMDFGAFVEILPGLEGLVHISQLDIGRVEKVSDVLTVGDEVKVKVIEIEPGTGKIRLSRMAVLLEEQGKTFEMPEPGSRGGRPPRRGGPPRGRS